MIPRRVAAVAAILAGLHVAPVPAQPSGPATGVIPGPRPKVCLVLSGGGARGAAHVGVLKALEEQRVPIDCIAGTSMGAVVGAAYASGMTVAEMSEMIEYLSLDALFKEQPPREERSIRRKQDEGRNLFSPEIGIDDDLEPRFAKGVVSGVRLETLLRRLSRVKGHVDFDTLPIPFRAVATDLVTGKAVVFREGSLALVMRASMSVPGAIAPAEIDGRLLIDGGLVNNLPVNLARDLGADVVIVVNLGTPLLRRDELKDVRSVAAQMLNILTEQNVQATLADLRSSDILILPELGDFSAGDFDRMKLTIPLGEAATRKVADRLAALSVSESQFAEYEATRRTVMVADQRPVDEIRFAPMRRVTPEFASTVIDTRPGDPLDPQKLDADLMRLYGTDDFEHVSYRLLDSPTRRILNIDAIEKSWGPDYARLGLALASDFSGRSYFNVLGQYRRTWLNPLGAEWRTDVALGRNSSIVSEFYQPLEPRQQFFVAPRLHAERYNIEVFEGRNPIAQYSFPTVLAGVDLGAQSARFGEVRVGLFGGVTRGSLSAGREVLSGAPSTSLGGLRFRAYVDQLDSMFFPKRGFAAEATATLGLKALGSEADYDQWDASMIIARTSGRHTLNASFRGTGPFGSADGANYTSQPWGGFLQQSGFATGQLLNERFAFGRLVYLYKLRDLPLLEGLYAGASAEVGDYGKPLLAGNPAGVLYSGSAFLALDSPIGPVYLGLGLGSQGNRAAYFFLGRP